MQKHNKSIFATISLVSLVLMFCLPFMISYHKWPEANFYNQMLACLLGVASVLGFFASNQVEKISIPATFFVPISLAFLIALQWIVGMGFFWQEVALSILYLLWAAMLMMIAVRLKVIVGIEVLVRWLATGLVIGGLFNVLVVFMQLIDADGFFWTFPRIRNNYTGNLAQVNLLTDYLSLALISIFYLYKKRYMNFRLVCFLTMLILVALGLTGSRMSWIYVVLIGVTSFYFGRKSDLSHWRGTAKLALFLPLVYGALQFGFPQFVELFVNGESILPSAPATKVVAFAGRESIRIDMLKQSLEIFSNYPLLGVGWGQYPWYDLLMADTYVSHKGFIIHSHNLFTQILVECGVFAGIIVLVGSVYWFVNLLRQGVTAEKWWVLLIVSIIFTHSMLEYPLWYAHFLGMFLVVVSLGDKSIDLSIIKPVLTKAVSGVIFLGAVTLICITTLQYIQIEKWISQYAYLSKRQRFEMLSEMTAMHQSTLIAEPLHLVLTRAYSLLPRNQAPLKSKIARYENILHYVQAKQDIYRYVLLLSADGRMDEAKDFLARAYTRQPGYAKRFEKQLEKGANRGSEIHAILYEELQRLKKQKANLRGDRTRE